jgi:hypothetical protein
MPTGFAPARGGASGRGEAYSSRPGSRHHAPRRRGRRSGGPRGASARLLVWRDPAPGRPGRHPHLRSRCSLRACLRTAFGLPLAVLAPADEIDAVNTPFRSRRTTFRCSRGIPTRPGFTTSWIGRGATLAGSGSISGVKTARTPHSRGRNWRSPSGSRRRRAKAKKWRAQAAVGARRGCLSRRVPLAACR